MKKCIRYLYTAETVLAASTPVGFAKALSRRRWVSAALVAFALLLGACTQTDPADTEPLDTTATPYTVEAEAARTVEDADASGERAAALYRSGDRATFRLTDVPNGTYRIGVRARAQAYYKGWPVLRLSLNGQRLGNNPVKRATYGTGLQNFGEVTVTRGQVVTAEFVNDRYDGKGKDRNVLVDYLVLEPVNTAKPEPGSDSITVSLGWSRKVKPDLFGFNNDQTIRGVQRDDETYNKSLGDLSPGTLRFPGGTSSNYWDWERADFVCGKGESYQLLNKGKMPCKLPNGYQSLNPPNHSLENFKTELERTGADAIFVLNMLTKRAGQTESNLSSALRMLTEAKRLGIAVKYVELGNEFYLPQGDRDASKDYKIAFPNAKAYVREAQAWIDALRRDFPNAHISVVGADRRAGAGKRRNTWNEVVTEALAGQADALSIHTYAGASGSTSAFLAIPQKRMDTLKNEFDALPQDLPLWITEYNLFSRDEAVQGTWAHGLFAATQTLSLLQEANVERMSFHSGVGNAVFGALFRNDSGFDYGASRFPAPSSPPTTIPFTRTASGQTLQLVAGAMRGATSARQLVFSDMPDLPGGQPGLVGWLFEGGQKEVILLNLSRDEQTVDLTNLAVEGSSVTRHAPPTLRVTGAAGQVQEDKGSVSSDLTLPAYSVTLVETEQ